MNKYKMHTKLPNKSHIEYKLLLRTRKMQIVKEHTSSYGQDNVTIQFCLHQLTKVPLHKRKPI